SLCSWQAAEPDGRGFWQGWRDVFYHWRTRHTVGFVSSDLHGQENEGAQADGGRTGVIEGGEAGAGSASQAGELCRKERDRRGGLCVGLRGRQGPFAAN